jgi:hypothetical protein
MAFLSYRKQKYNVTNEKNVSSSVSCAWLFSSIALFLTRRTCMVNPTPLGEFTSLSFRLRMFMNSLSSSFCFFIFRYFVLVFIYFCSCIFSSCL